MSRSGDIMSTSGDVQYIEGISQCTHDIPNVLIVSPQCTEHTLYRVKITSSFPLLFEVCKIPGVPKKCNMFDILQL